MILIKKAIKIAIVIITIGLLLILFIPSRTPQIVGNNSVASIQRVKLGEIDQYIMIRGKDLNNPILLFLHGGPGYSQISFARKYQEELENHFIVVNWDQRGSGKSYTFSIPNETMTRQQFIEDSKELIDYLCHKYDKHYIYLVGHSWGSELGLYIVDQYPEKIAAFISIGQMVNGIENEIVSYEYVLSEAKKNDDFKAISELERIGRPPYQNIVKDTMTQRKWLEKYGGVERLVNSLRDIILSSFFSPEYTGIDLIKFAIGSKFTADTMWGQNEDVDFIRDLPEVNVPVYFVAGRYDYNTPSTLIEKYYNHLSAPRKALIWFEESAHFPHFEETDKFANLMILIKEDAKGIVKDKKNPDE